jgi:four helix bundle protein
MQKLILFRKIYDLILWVYPCVNNFPKNQRFILGQQILNALIDFFKIIIEANSYKDKKRLLLLASVELDKIRFLARLAKDLKFTSIKRYGVTVKRMNEIGKLLGGMIRKFS